MRAVNLKAVRGGESALAMAKRRYNTVHTRDVVEYNIPLTVPHFSKGLYSLVPIRRHVPINSHASRHGTCNGPYKSHISMPQKV